MLDTRWEMISLVVPGMCLAKASRIFRSVAVSTALVESSRISTLGLFNSARAMHSRCRWPPETFRPPWSIQVSYFWGKRWINSSAQARRQASSHSSRAASSLPQRRFSRIVPENSTFFCSTTATLSRSVSRS